MEQLIVHMHMHVDLEERYREQYTILYVLYPTLHRRLLYCCVELERVSNVVIFEDIVRL